MLTIYTIRLKRQFIEKYPSCYKAISAIKGGIGSNKYNQFAIQLQRKEASLIFDRVNIGLIKQGVPSYNIYDSILCLKEDEETARREILKAFSDIGITPRLNFTDYGSLQAAA